MTIGVRIRLARDVAWRGTEALGLVDGPSTRACGGVSFFRAWFGGKRRSPGSWRRGETNALVVDYFRDSS